MAKPPRGHPRRRCFIQSTENIYGDQHTILTFFLRVGPTGRLTQTGHLRMPYSNRKKGRDGTIPVPTSALPVIVEEL